MLARITTNGVFRFQSQRLMRMMSKASGANLQKTMKPLFERKPDAKQPDNGQKTFANEMKTAKSERRLKEVPHNSQNYSEYQGEVLIPYVRRSISLLKQAPNQFKLQDLVSKLNKHKSLYGEIAPLMTEVLRITRVNKEIFTNSFILSEILECCQEKGIIMEPEYFREMTEVAIKNLHYKEEAREHLKTLSQLYGYVFNSCPSMLEPLIDETFNVLTERSNSILFDHQAHIAKLIVLSKIASEKSNQIVTSLAENIRSLAPVCNVSELRLTLESYLEGGHLQPSTRASLYEASKAIAERIAKRPVDIRSIEMLDWCWIMAWQSSLPLDGELKNAFIKLAELNDIDQMVFQPSAVAIKMNRTSIEKFLHEYGKSREAKHIISQIAKQTQGCFISKTNHPSITLSIVAFRKQVFDYNSLITSEQAAHLKASLRQAITADGDSTPWRQALDILESLHIDRHRHDPHVDLSCLITPDYIRYERQGSYFLN